MIDKEKKEIKKIVRKHSLRLVLLFGSRAFGKFVRQDSDFDIAYLSEKKLNLKDESKLAGELAKIFKTSQIDITDINKSGPLLIKQIFDNHIILFSESRTLYDKYMIYSERRYAEAKPLFKLQSEFNKNFLKVHAK